MRTGILAGSAAGAAGSAALNAVTYLDMTVRGRPGSSTPQDTVKAMEERLPVSVPGDGETRENRVTGLASLTGIVTGIGVGAVFGVLHRAGLRLPKPVGAVVVGLAVMAATDGSMVRLRVTDPRTWSATDWVGDLVPHLVYGAVTYTVLEALDRR
jgi:hypothetical protein